MNKNTRIWGSQRSAEDDTNLLGYSFSHVNWSIVVNTSQETTAPIFRV